MRITLRKKARLSFWQRERIKVRVSTKTAAAAQTISLSRHCRVPGELDDSRTAEQRFLHARATPIVFDREFDPSDSYARHRLIQSRALPPDNRSPVCNGRTDADGEICGRRNFGCASGAKGFAQYPLPSFARIERDSRKLIVITKAISEKVGLRCPSPQSSPRNRGEAAKAE